jgi:hypothetical protein
MIVVCGVPEWRVGPDGLGRAAGTAVDIARAAVAEGARVELIGRVGDDPTGDALLLDLAAPGIGHVAVLRDPGRPTPVVLASASASAPLVEDPLDGLAEPGEAATSPTEPEGAAPRPVVEAADLELGLRYLVDYGVIVVEPLDAASLRAVSDAAAFAGAHMIALVPAGAEASGDLRAATIIELPEADPDGVFGAVVGAYAAALDRGVDPASAFNASVAGTRWEAVKA